MSSMRQPTLIDILLLAKNETDKEKLFNDIAAAINARDNTKSNIIQYAFMRMSQPQAAHEAGSPENNNAALLQLLLLTQYAISKGKITDSFHITTIFHKLGKLAELDRLPQTQELSHVVCSLIGIISQGGCDGAGISNIFFGIGKILEANINLEITTNAEANLLYLLAQFPKVQNVSGTNIFSTIHGLRSLTQKKLCESLKEDSTQMQASRNAPFMMLVKAMEEGLTFQNHQIGSILYNLGKLAENNCLSEIDAKTELAINRLITMLNVNGVIEINISNIVYGLGALAKSGRCPVLNFESKRIVSQALGAISIHKWTQQGFVMSAQGLINMLHKNRFENLVGEPKTQMLKLVKIPGIKTDFFKALRVLQDFVSRDQREEKSFSVTSFGQTNNSSFTLNAALLSMAQPASSSASNFNTTNSSSTDGVRSIMTNPFGQPDLSNPFSMSALCSVPRFGSFVAIAPVAFSSSSSSSSSSSNSSSSNSSSNNSSSSSNSSSNNNSSSSNNSSSNNSSSNNSSSSSNSTSSSSNNRSSSNSSSGNSSHYTSLFGFSSSSSSSSSAGKRKADDDTDVRSKKAFNVSSTSLHETMDAFKNCWIVDTNYDRADLIRIASILLKEVASDKKLRELTTNENLISFVNHANNFSANNTTSEMFDNLYKSLTKLIQASSPEFAPELYYKIGKIITNDCREFLSRFHNQLAAPWMRAASKNNSKAYDWLVLYMEPEADTRRRGIYR